MENQVGKYTIEDIIGRGSYGSVYKCIDEEGSVFALKIFSS